MAQHIQEMLVAVIFHYCRNYRHHHGVSVFLKDGTFQSEMVQGR